jgi:hypothetical protein
MLRPFEVWTVVQRNKVLSNAYDVGAGEDIVPKYATRQFAASWFSGQT